MKNNSKTKEEQPILLSYYLLGILALWSILVVLSLAWNLRTVKSGILEAARIEARTAFEKDIVYRRWNADYGGVYATVTEVTQPNPYLDVPERDITTPLGKKLTKINPAYMTRQVHELALKSYGVRGHITSLNPIRPANAPDPWETRALKAFRTGLKEVSSVEEMEGGEYMRLMQPLLTEKGCIECHAVQGYKLGDIRGGISVSIPMAPLMAIEQSNVFTLYVLYGLLWLVGLVGIGFGINRLNQQIHKRKAKEEALRKAHSELELRVAERTAELVKVNEQLKIEIEEHWQMGESLRESEEQYRALFGQAADSIVIVDPNTGMLSEFNDKACKSLGYTRQELEKLKISEFEVSESEEEGKKHLEKVMNEGKDEFLTKHRRKDGEIRDIVVNTKVISVHGKKFIQGIWRDITDQMRTDEQIKASLREKEVLLKEVHHRVKNNLQIISGLLDMSRRRANNREAVDLLSETDAKIHTMALIHTQLYQSDRFDEVDMKSHVRNLITYISQLYGAKKNITLVINTHDVILSVTQAIPFALALNELIANVFKHAFEEGKGGILEVFMEQSSDGAISVKIRDDGIGIPEDVDIDNTDTLGLKLVRRLVLKQLKGKLRIERNKGTEVFIEFKVSEEEVNHV